MPYNRAEVGDECDSLVTHQFKFKIMPAKQKTAAKAPKTDKKILDSVATLKSVPKKALVLNLIDKSKLIILESEITQLSATSAENMHTNCKVNSFLTTESMEKVLAKLGWEVSPP